jgi:hypothetical protein
MAAPPTPKQVIVGIVVSTASISFACGVTLMIGVNYLTRGDLIGWIFLASAVVMGAAGVYGARTKLAALP